MLTWFACLFVLDQLEFWGFSKKICCLVSKKIPNRKSWGNWGDLWVVWLPRKLRKIRGKHCPYVLLYFGYGVFDLLKTEENWSVNSIRFFSLAFFFKLFEAALATSSTNFSQRKVSANCCNLPIYLWLFEGSSQMLLWNFHTN